ncbi:hypothetical protein ANN_19406 [Periplaneta americana]|uniref:PiggyBac transposable element-derived protein domain-containing protein n=1 Tax=Periplaneta americana TaxID=6978 RepID=A0ABQ8SAP9_PERAM|nr:hypothetical protein ANN_19406 [Periplaneta americana]
MRIKTDRLAALRYIWNIFLNNCRSKYIPSENVTIDEQLVPFRGRCQFVQYMPSKPAKYRLKIFWLCDAKNSYAFDGIIYTGRKPGEPVEKNLGKNTVLQLFREIQNSGRNVTCDNFFMSVPLAQKLLNMKLTIVGTMKQNKTEIPQIMKANKSRQVHSSEFGFNGEMTLVSYVPKRNKSVILLSTTNNDKTVIPDMKNKPEIIIYYNKTKGAVDMLDQMTRNFSCKRKMKRWPFVVFQLTGFSSKRRVFLKTHAKELMMPRILERSASKNIQKTIKEAMVLCGVPCPEGDVEQQRGTLKRKRCSICPTRKDRKCNNVCVTCKKFVCGEHSVMMCVDLEEDLTAIHPACSKTEEKTSAKSPVSLDSESDIDESSLSEATSNVDISAEGHEGNDTEDCDGRMSEEIVGKFCSDDGGADVIRETTSNDITPRPSKKCKVAEKWRNKQSIIGNRGGELEVGRQKEGEKNGESTKEERGERRSETSVGSERESSESMNRVRSMEQGGIGKEKEKPLLDYMLEVCHEKIEEELKDANYAAIMVDETDIAEKIQLALVYTYERNKTVHQQFRRFFNSVDQTANSITESILKEVDRILKNDRRKIIAQAFADASVMSGNMEVSEKARASKPVGVRLECASASASASEGLSSSAVDRSWRDLEFEYSELSLKVCGSRYRELEIGTLSTMENLQQILQAIAEMKAEMNKHISEVKNDISDVKTEMKTT